MARNQEKYTVKKFDKISIGLSSPEAILEISKGEVLTLEPATKTIAVFAVLADKDVCGIIECVGGEFDEWHISELSSERALDKESLQKQIDNCCHECVIHSYASISDAYQAAKSSADESMRIVVFGSFLTVAEVLGQEV